MYIFEKCLNLLSLSYILHKICLNILISAVITKCWRTVFRHTSLKNDAIEVVPLYNYLI